MNGVLADTSIWVDHFRRGNPALVTLLESDRVLIHPMIVGEIACGSPPTRQRTLSNLSALPVTQQASMREVLAFVEREQLFGVGCGLVDLTLLASALMTPGVQLWTLDKRLLALASRFGAVHLPPIH